jgi:hypothetical protein
LKTTAVDYPSYLSGSLLVVVLEGRLQKCVEYYSHRHVGALFTFVKENILPKFSRYIT